MAQILYSQAITEDLDDLKELEKYHRYSHLFQRVRMLRLLKSEECSNLGEAARALGYSWRQCQRWFAFYQKGAIEELLRSRVHERGRQELLTPEALEDLKENMKMGKIAPIGQADEFLRERHGIEYAHPDGVGQLLRRHKIKLKTGRPRPVALATRKQTEKSRMPSKKLRGRDRSRRQKSATHCENGKKPLKVLALDEARFGLINWHNRRYCPMGFRPPWIVKRSYPTSGLICTRRSNLRSGRVSVCTCQGWTTDVLRYSWMNSQREIPRSPPPPPPPRRRARRRAKPSLRANSASREHQLPQAPTTLAGAGP
jgi:transposase